MFNKREPFDEHILGRFVPLLGQQLEPHREGLVLLDDALEDVDKRTIDVFRNRQRQSLGGQGQGARLNRHIDQFNAPEIEPEGMIEHRVNQLGKVGKTAMPYLDQT
jgi:hypothetical protein